MNTRTLSNCAALLAAAVGIGMSSQAAAQSCVAAGVTPPNATATINCGQYVATSAQVTQIGSREEGVYAALSVQVDPKCYATTQVANGAPPGNGAYWAAVLRSDPNYRVHVETLRTAYALNRPVVIYSQACLRFSQTDTNIQFPMISGVNSQ
jgi:hypothetical protein